MTPAGLATVVGGPSIRHCQTMDSAPLWNPKSERLPRRELDMLQCSRLRQVCVRAARDSDFYRRRFASAGFDPASLRSLEDARAIPLLDRTAWEAGASASEPFGMRCALDPITAVRCHSTSGTSGREPLRVLDTRTDWQWIVECWCTGLWGAGVRPGDRVLVAFGYGAFIGFWGAHDALARIGCMVIPTGGQDSVRRLSLIRELDISVVCLTPTYALRLPQLACEAGIDLRDSSVRLVVVSGEPGGSIPSVRALVEQEWGAECRDAAGMTELGTIMAFQCPCDGGAMHIIEDQFFEEVIDPQSGDPVPYGCEGERVVTSFGRRLMPLVRYRTGDRVVRVAGGGCACGRSWDKYRGGILGRIDDLRVVRGANIHPNTVESLVRLEPSISEYRIRIWRRNERRDEVTVEVELKAGAESDSTAVVKRLAENLSREHGGLQILVDVLPTGVLPRPELKSRRLIDERAAR